MVDDFVKTVDLLAGLMLLICLYNSLNGAECTVSSPLIKEKVSCKCVLFHVLRLMERLVASATLIGSKSYHMVHCCQV